jgi:peptidyl-prolyl cis-trans isomerase C
MRAIFGAVAALFLTAQLVSTGPLAAQTPVLPGPAGEDTIVARVDGQPIRRSDVLSFQRSLPAQFQQVPIEALLEPIVERLVSQRLLVADGRKKNLQTDAEVRQRLTQFEDRVIQEVLLNRVLADKVNEAALRTRYAAYQKENPGKEEVRASHILVNSEAQAKEILTALKGGADFGKLAGEKSIDPAGKSSGGDLGYFGKDEMVPEFAEAAFAMKAGDTSVTPVKTQFGWHVIRVADRRTVAESFEEVRERLSSELSQEIMQSYVDGLRKTAKVELFGLDGKPLPATPAGPTITPAK